MRRRQRDGLKGSNAEHGNMPTMNAEESQKSQSQCCKKLKITIRGKG